MNTAIIEPNTTAELKEVKSSAGLAMIFIVCFLCTFFSGIASMLKSVYLPVAVKDLLGSVSDAKMNDVSALINSVFIFGWMFGGIVWGVICDKIGRSKSVMLSTAFYGIFMVLTGLSSSWFIISACRFLTGFGIGGVLVTTTVLIEESWSDKMKPIIQGFVGVAMPIGFFAAGAVNNLFADWRSAFYIGAAPILLAIVAIFSLTESVKWKSNTETKAENKNLDQKLFSPAYNKNLFTGAVIFGAMLIGLWAIFSWAPTWVQSISTSADVQQQRGTTMMVLAGCGIIGSLVSGFVVNAMGLRKTMMMCFAVCFVMTFVIFKLNSDVTIATFAEMAVLVFFFGISQGAMAVYIPELFPVNVRAAATGFCFNAGRLFTGTVVFFIGALVSMLGGYGNSIFVFAFIFLVGLIATFFSKDIKT